MQDPNWSQLKAKFPRDRLEWRIVEVSADLSQAKVRPQLAYQAVLDRLNSCLGSSGWSNRFIPVGSDSIACELSISRVCKSALVSFKASWQDTVTAAYDAFVYAAEAFGLQTHLDTRQTYWVDYDPESNSILFEPVLELMPAPLLEVITPLPENSKPEGQQAIDRLVDRLKDKGLGLEAAKLLVAHGGYGTNPESARELYSKLRTLLVGETQHE